MRAIAVFHPQDFGNSSQIKGTVVFEQAYPGANTVVTFNLEGFVLPGLHGCHIHEYGDITEGCASACSHYNPRGTRHGSVALFGADRHVGDLCNNLNFKPIAGHFYYNETRPQRCVVRQPAHVDDLVQLSGPETVVGRMLVIHGQADDGGLHRDDDCPLAKESGITGNAGSRIACAVIGFSRSATKCSFG